MIFYYDIFWIFLYIHSIQFVYKVFKILFFIIDYKIFEIFDYKILKYNF